jgi:alkyl hydroperoxide reductase subunit F
MVIDDEKKVEIQRILSALVLPVKLLFFTQENACPACKQQQELLEELVTLSDKLELRMYDFVLHGDEAINYRIDKIPATAVVAEKDYRVRFYGVTAGYEFSSLLEAILMVSAGSSGLDPELEARVREIKEPVHIQVLVTLTCPYCPRMVHIAQQFALANENIRADMIDAAEFPHLSQRYNVTAVPKIVVNETHSFEGALPEEQVYMEILKAVNPEEYRRLIQALKEMEGKRNVKQIAANHEYEVIIVGGGPAAMSAAIYAARKGLDVALIAKKLGGQIIDTASIENYLGLPGITGAQMAEQFQDHMEQYPIAEKIGTNAVQVKKEKNTFVVTTDDNLSFKSLTVIYCAGKEYRRLGVPNEEQFIGKGIGFCATCDAPLYKEKRVAVVGGGNSALTAARDLLSYASEIHIVHRREEFTADATLVQEVLQAKNVTFHAPMIVRSFLGENKLTGISLESADGKERLDLNVDGVFLEVGLTPNTDPLKGFIELNDHGEVQVNRNQSTAVEGFFAAGDATDVDEKQITVAVGQGAQAALAAHRYLFQHELTKSRIGPKDTWQ